MQTKKLISVLIPVFNVEKYLDEALNSIESQTYDNIEIILINDCSSDRTESICLEHKKKNNNIIYYKNENNLGIAESLNKALSLSNGEYIVRMDGDDISLENRIQTMFDFLEKNQHIDIVGTSTITIDENGNEIGHYYPIEKHNEILKTIYWASPLLHIWMCKKEIYNDVGFYKFPPIEDYDFLLRAIDKGKILHNIQEPLYKVRLRNGNTADTYGFKQLEFFELVGKLHKKGKLSNLKPLNKQNTLQEYLYQKSRSLYQKGVSFLKKKKPILGIILLLTSGIISSYQRRYLYRRIRLKLYR